MARASLRNPSPSLRREMTAFFCVSSSVYFLGAVGMINSLRLVGHDERIYVLDCGLTDAQRELLAPQATIVAAPPGREPFTLKTEAPLRHPVATTVLIDADMIVTRSLTPLLELAAEGNVIAFENPVDRFVPAWGELLGLGELRRQSYLCSGFVAMGAPLSAQVLRLLEDRQRRVLFKRGYFGAKDHDYELMFADQDVLNAILAATVEPEQIVALDARLAPMPPFEGLRVVDEQHLRCAYSDGTEPYLVHQSLPFKPWLEPTYDGVYSRLLRRALGGANVAISVPADSIPLGLRKGPLGFAERQRVKAREQIRWRLASPGASTPPAHGRKIEPADSRASNAAFYTVADERYFLGVVGLINSLRLVGHDEPIHLLDCGLTPVQCQLLAAQANVVANESGAPPWLLKTVLPMAHPSPTMALLDADMVAARSLGPLLEGAISGSLVAFRNGEDRFVDNWGELIGAARPARRGPYLSSAAIIAAGEPATEVLTRVHELRGLVEFDLTYWRRNVAGYAFTFADQDLFNAILATEQPPRRVEALDARLASTPPFDGLRLIDESTLRCAYEDGTEPFLVHHHVVKPWLEPTHHGVYSRMLRRLLIGEDLAIRVPASELPLRFRSGLRSFAARERINLSEAFRYRVREPLATRLGVGRGR